MEAILRNLQSLFGRAQSSEGVPPAASQPARTADAKRLPGALSFRLMSDRVHL